MSPAFYERILKQREKALGKLLDAIPFAPGSFDLKGANYSPAALDAIVHASRELRQRIDWSVVTGTMSINLEHFALNDVDQQVVIEVFDQRGYDPCLSRKVDHDPKSLKGYSLELRW